MRNKILYSTLGSACSGNNPNHKWDLFFKRQKQDKEKKKKQDGDAIEEEEDEEESAPTFQAILQNEIMNKAQIGQTSADSIVSISDVPLIVPRLHLKLRFIFLF